MAAKRRTKAETTSLKEELASIRFKINFGAFQYSEAQMKELYDRERFLQQVLAPVPRKKS